MSVAGGKTSSCFRDLLLGVFALMCLASGAANAHPSEQLLVAKDVLVQLRENDFVQLSGVTAGDSGHLIAVGERSADRKAWAAGFDFSGRLDWQLIYPDFTSPGIGNAKFKSVAVNGDRTLLCGALPFTPGDYGKAAAVLLSRSGMVLQATNPVPLHHSDRGFVSLESCAPDGAGFLAVGRIYQQIAGSTPDPLQPSKGMESLYWLLRLDSDGGVLWERQIPSKLHVLDSISDIVNVSGDAVTFFGSAGNTVTEILVMTNAGEVTNQQVREGRYVLLPSLSGGMPSVFGYSADGVSGVTALDEFLKASDPTPCGFSLSEFAVLRGFSRDRGRAILFGQKINQGIGPRYVTAAAICSPDKQAEYSHLADNPREDLGQIDAVVPINAEEFVTARGILKGDYGNAPCAYVALNFVTIQQRGSN